MYHLVKRLTIRFALLILIVVLIDWGLPYLVEPINLENITKEINYCLQVSSTMVENNMQSVKDSGIRDNNGELTVNYSNYLNSLKDIANNKSYESLDKIEDYLRAGRFNGVKVTPLSFGLAYLDIDKLNVEFREDVNEVINLKFKGSDINGKGNAFDAIFDNDAKYDLEDAKAELIYFDVIDVTNLDSCTSYERGIYNYIYGNNVSDYGSNVFSIMGRKYIAFYQIKYSISITPYTCTNFFRRPDDSSLTDDYIKNHIKRNKYGYCAYPQYVISMSKMYTLTN